MAAGFNEIYQGLGFKKNYAAKAGGSQGAKEKAPAAKAGGYGAAPAAPAPAAGSAGEADGGAYEHLMQVYDAALEAQRARRRAAYEAAAREQQRLYEQNVSKVNEAADRALQEAYVNRMQSARTMGQQLAAQGLNGGYSETTAAGLHNSYSNARNALETERSSQLNELGMTYQNNMAAARNILDTGNAGDFAEYITNAAKLIAANPTRSLSVEQSGTADSGGAGWYQLYRQLLAGGMSAAEAVEYLAGGGANVQQMFA